MSGPAEKRQQVSEAGGWGGDPGKVASPAPASAAGATSPETMVGQLAAATTPPDQPAPVAAPDWVHVMLNDLEAMADGIKDWVQRKRGTIVAPAIDRTSPPDPLTPTPPIGATAPEVSDAETDSPHA
jgi:hypothetical protein